MFKILLHTGNNFLWSSHIFNNLNNINYIMQQSYLVVYYFYHRTGLIPRRSVYFTSIYTVWKEIRIISILSCSWYHSSNAENLFMALKSAFKNKLCYYIANTCIIQMIMYAKLFFHQLTQALAEKKMQNVLHFIFQSNSVCIVRKVQLSVLCNCSIIFSSKWRYFLTRQNGFGTRKNWKEQSNTNAYISSGLYAISLQTKNQK